MADNVFPVSREFKKQWDDAVNSSINFEHLKLMVNRPMYKERFKLIVRAEDWVLERIYNDPSLMEIVD